MCGFSGVLGIGPNRISFLSNLENQKEKIKHRGPDEEGIYQDDEFIAISSRLIVRGSESGKQPRVSTDKRYVLFYNGELYQPELNDSSDTNYLFELLIQKGIDCLTELNGMYAFAFWDNQEKELILSRDKFGVKPLYYKLSKEGDVEFSSEYFLEIEDFDSYLQHGYRGENSLKPGEILRIKEGRVEKKCLPFIIKKSNQTLSTLIEKSVQNQIVSERNVGMFLSGGLDSSVIAHFAKKEIPDLKTFTVGFNDKSFDESSKALDVSKHLRTEHHSFILGPEEFKQTLEEVCPRLDQPFCDLGFFPLAFLSKKIKDEVTVVLSGDGGDELFAGYPTLAASIFASRSPKLLKYGTGLLSKIFNDSSKETWSYRLDKLTSKIGFNLEGAHSSWRNFFEEDEILQLTGGFSKNSLYENAFAEASELFPKDKVNQLLFADFKVWLVQNNFTKLDRATSLYSLEGRVPFIDNQIVEHVFSMRGKDKFSVFNPKFLLKDVAKEILPIKIVNQKKSAFHPPIKNWYKNELEEWLRDKLLNGALINEKGFSKKYINSILDSEKYETFKIHNLLCLELWFERQS